MAEDVRALNLLPPPLDSGQAASGFARRPCAPLSSAGRAEPPRSASCYPSGPERSSVGRRGDRRPLGPPRPPHEPRASAVDSELKWLSSEQVTLNTVGGCG
eukprot:scaffold46896_cov22-Phaeocystis_antarctica.AAC.1